MYIKIETRIKTRVSKNSAVFRKFSYDVQTGADIRTGHWDFDDEIMNEGAMPTWTLAMISSTRRDGKVRKQRTYLCRVSRSDIIMEFKQAHIKGQDFNICAFSKLVTSVETKFPADSERVLAMVAGKLGPIADRVVQEFKGTEEFECFSRFAVLKREVDARIKSLQDDDAKQAEEESRRREEYQRKCDEARGSTGGADQQKPKSTHKSRVGEFAMELAHKFARAAKMRFHPDVVKEGDAKAKQERAIIIKEIVDGAMKLLESMVDSEFELVKAADDGNGRF